MFISSSASVYAHTLQHYHNMFDEENCYKVVKETKPLLDSLNRYIVSSLFHARAVTNVRLIQSDLYSKEFKP